MQDQDSAALSAHLSSKDPRQMFEAGLGLARSDREQDLRELQESLKSAEFLQRLDTAENYRGLPGRLHVGRIVKMLGRNPSPAAKHVLVELTQSATFISAPARIDVLITACASVRPAPTEVISFWDKHSQKDDGYTPLTIEAMVNNGSPAAIELLEKKMADPSHEDDDKIGWMRSSILTHRNDAVLLRGCRRMLSGPLPAQLRPALVEVLFDYRPQEWFRPAAVFKPPDREQATPEARAELRKLGEYVLKAIALSDTQKRAVEATLKNLG